MNSEALDFYSSPQPMTDLCSINRSVFEGLPDEPDSLMRVVRGCVADGALFASAYGRERPSGREDERQIRSAALQIDRILQLHDAPLHEPRPPELRLIGTCRNFATLSVALIRYNGVPARVRAGFAGYYSADTWMDHWIIEYWGAAEECWVRVDSELDDDALKKKQPELSAELLAQTGYLTGAEAWLKCLSGELDPNRCNMGGDNWGIGEVRGSVLLDLAALNQNEMLPWDSWGRMEEAYRSETETAYDELLDEVSEIVVADRFDAIRDMYEAHEDLRVPASMLPMPSTKPIR